MNTTIVFSLQTGNTTVLSESVFCIFDSLFDALTFPFCREVYFSLCQSDVFYFFILWMLHIFLYKWNFWNSKSQKLFRGMFFIKVGLSPSKKNCFICFNESFSKFMKTAFYFILEALFILKIFNFFPWLFGQIEERLD